MVSENERVEIAQPGIVGCSDLDLRAWSALDEMAISPLDANSATTGAEITIYALCRQCRLNAPHVSSLTEALVPFTG